jgi:hypothetical protein
VDVARKGRIPIRILTPTHTLALATNNRRWSPSNRPELSGRRAVQRRHRILGFCAIEGTRSPTKIETRIRRGSLIRYENVEFNYSGIHSTVRPGCFSRSKCG